MSKQSGLGDNLYVSGHDLSGDINVYNTSGGPGLIDITGIDKYAHERIGGLRSGAVDCTSFFNPTAGQEHTVFSALPTADQIMTVCRGTVLGSAALCQIGKQIDYDGTRDNNGNFTFKVEAQSNGFGQDWGYLLTPGKRTDTAATNGTGVDFAASTSFGFQAYLHVFAFTGTDVTVKLQDSADNSTFADVTSGGFTTISSTTPQAQRKAVGGTATVRRYVRVATTTSGGFTSATFAVVLKKNKVAVSF